MWFTFKSCTCAIVFLTFAALVYLSQNPVSISAMPSNHFCNTNKYNMSAMSYKCTVMNRLSHIWNRNCLPFQSTWIHHRFLVHGVARSLFFCEGLCRSLFRIWLSRRCSLTFICLCLWILHFRLLCRVSLSFIGFLYDRQIPLIISQIRMGNVCQW